MSAESFNANVERVVREGFAPFMGDDEALAERALFLVEQECDPFHLGLDDDEHRIASDASEKE